MAWYKLKNPKSSLFYDPTSKLKLTAATDGKSWTPEVVEYNGKKTKAITTAIQAGHIEVVEKPSKDELETQKAFLEGTGDAPESKKVEGDEEGGEEETQKLDLTKPLEEMNKEELKAYYSETYEVSAKDIKAFNKLSTEDMLKTLKDLDS